MHQNYCHCQTVQKTSQTSTQPSAWLMASQGSPRIRYISKCTEQGRTLQDKVPLEEIRPQILRIIKIRRFKGELKGFDDRSAAKPLVHPLSRVVLPAMSSQEALLAGHFPSTSQEGFNVGTH